MSGTTATLGRRADLGVHDRLGGPVESLSSAVTLDLSQDDAGSPRISFPTPTKPAPIRTERTLPDQGSPERSSGRRAEGVHVVPTRSAPLGEPPVGIEPTTVRLQGGLPG